MLGWTAERARIAAAAGSGRSRGRRPQREEPRMIDLGLDEAGEIVTEIQKAGGKALAVVGDVRTEAGAARIIDEAVAALGGVDVLVDVVGEAIFAPSHQQTEADWDYQMTKNLKQFFFVMKAVIPHMIAQGSGGAITAITSVDGFSSSRFHVAYGAAKAG